MASGAKHRRVELKSEITAFANRVLLTPEDYEYAQALLERNRRELEDSIASLRSGYTATRYGGTGLSILQFLNLREQKILKRVGRTELKTVNALERTCESSCGKPIDEIPAICRSVCSNRTCVRLLVAHLTSPEFLTGLHPLEVIISELRKPYSYPILLPDSDLMVKFQSATVLVSHDPADNTTNLRIEFSYVTSPHPPQAKETGIVTEYMAEKIEDVTAKGWKLDTSDLELQRERVAELRALEGKEEAKEIEPQGLPQAFFHAASFLQERTTMPPTSINVKYWTLKNKLQILAAKWPDWEVVDELAAELCEILTVASEYLYLPDWREEPMRMADNALVWKIVRGWPAGKLFNVSRKSFAEADPSELVNLPPDLPGLAEFLEKKKKKEEEAQRKEKKEKEKKEKEKEETERREREKNVTGARPRYRRRIQKWTR